MKTLWCNGISNWTHWLRMINSMQNSLLMQTSVWNHFGLQSFFFFFLIISESWLDLWKTALRKLCLVGSMSVERVSTIWPGSDVSWHFLRTSAHPIYRITLDSGNSLHAIIHLQADLGFIGFCSELTSLDN